jgi:peptide-methionine (S)-S-oxide reductase
MSLLASLFGDSAKTRLVRPEDALPGRAEPLPPPALHPVLGTPPLGAAPPGHAEVFLGMGCFWGAERRLYQQPGVWTTAVGYQGGFTPNPTYREVCTGLTGHVETVRVVFDPARTSLDALLRVFWESHDPTQGMRQGNDIGTQYRSCIYWSDAAHEAQIRASAARYGAALAAAGLAALTTELRAAPPFYAAEEYHQQYLHKNPDGYCGLRGTGVACPVGVGVAAL